MSLSVMNHVWKHSQHRGTALLTMLAIADSANDEGWSWIGQEKLAAKTRAARRNLIDTLEKLEKSGELVIFSRFDENSETLKRASNLYLVRTSDDALPDFPKDLMGFWVNRKLVLRDEHGVPYGYQNERGEVVWFKPADSDPQITTLVIPRSLPSDLQITTPVISRSHESSIEPSHKPKKETSSQATKNGSGAGKKQHHTRSKIEQKGEEKHPTDHQIMYGIVRDALRRNPACAPEPASGYITLVLSVLKGTSKTAGLNEPMDVRELRGFIDWLHSAGEVLPTFQAKVQQLTEKFRADPYREQYIKRAAWKAELAKAAPEPTEPEADDDELISPEEMDEIERRIEQIAGAK